MCGFGKMAAQAIRCRNLVRDPKAISTPLWDIAQGLSGFADEFFRIVRLVQLSTPNLFREPADDPFPGSSGTLIGLIAGRLENAERPSPRLSRFADRELPARDSRAIGSIFGNVERIRP
jgi:hypothetical protein